MSDKSKYTVFAGKTYYPIGGMEDFHSYGDNIEEIKAVIETDKGLDDDVWCHIVCEGKIILKGSFLNYYSDKELKWEWE